MRSTLRLLHAIEELPRVGREALDVAALALGVEHVEREARLARARHAGDDRQASERDVDVDALAGCARGRRRSG